MSSPRIVNLPSNTDKLMSAAVNMGPNSHNSSDISLPTENIKKTLTLCMLGNVCMLIVAANFFFKINSFEKFFQEHYQNVKWFGSRSGLIFCQF